jgi:hypothetical protein
MDELIIGRDRYFQLKKLLDSKDPENLKLLLNIIDSSDIEKSFLHLLNLYTKQKNKLYAFSCQLGQSKNLTRFILKLLAYKSSKFDDNVTEISLDLVLRIYDSYLEQYKPNESKNEIKLNKLLLVDEFDFESSASRYKTLTSKQLKKNINARNN